MSHKNLDVKLSLLKIPEILACLRKNFFRYLFIQTRLKSEKNVQYFCKLKNSSW